MSQKRESVNVDYHRIIELLHSKYGYKFRINSILAMEEFCHNEQTQWKPLNDTALARICFHAGLISNDCTIEKGQLRSKQKVIDSCKIDASVNPYNPIENYILERIDKAHKNTQMNKLKLAIQFEKPLHFDLLKRWLYGCVEMIKNPLYQNSFLVLYGDQGIGKSTFFAKLFEGVQEYFYEGRPLVTEKDHRIKLGTTWAWCIDEVGTIFRMNDRDQLKQFATQKVIIERRPFKAQPEKIDRLASFCGTTNDKKILTDPTGNRRYHLCSVSSIDRMLFNSIDIQLLWAEIAADLWLKDARHELEMTEEMIELQKEDAEEGRLQTLAETVLDEFLEPKDGESVATVHLEALLGWKSHKYRETHIAQSELGDYVKLKNIKKVQKQRGKVRTMVLANYSLTLPKYDWTWSREKFIEQIKVNQVSTQ